MKGSPEGSSGQATVEAAILLPSLGVLVALMVEPCCVLFTRALMYEAATEAVRVAATAPDDELDDVVRSYVVRRLKAVPEVPLFHVGGTEDWQVTVVRTGDKSSVEVGVVGHVRPLPIAGVAFSALGSVDGDGVVVTASVCERVRPDWLEGDYATWIDLWE